MRDRLHERACLELVSNHFDIFALAREHLGDAQGLYVVLLVQDEDVFACCRLSVEDIPGLDDVRAVDAPMCSGTRGRPPAAANTLSG
jgi:hypothetical protein